MNEDRNSHIESSRFNRENDSYPRRRETAFHNKYETDHSSRSNFSDHSQPSNTFPHDAHSKSQYNDHQYNNNNNSNRNYVQRENYIPTNEYQKNQTPNNFSRNPTGEQFHHSASSIHHNQQQSQQQQPQWERVKLTNETCPLPARIPPPISLSSSSSRNTATTNGASNMDSGTLSVLGAGETTRLFNRNNNNTNPSKEVSNNDGSVAGSNNKSSYITNNMNEITRNQFVQRIDNNNNNSSTIVVRERNVANTTDLQDSLQANTVSQFDPSKPFASLFEKPSSNDQQLQSSSYGTTNGSVNGSVNDSTTGGGWGIHPHSQSVFDGFNHSDFPLPNTETHTETSIASTINAGGVQQLVDNHHNDDIVNTQFEKKYSVEKYEKTNRYLDTKAKPKVLFDPDSNAFKEFTISDRAATTTATANTTTNNKHQSKSFVG